LPRSLKSQYDAIYDAISNADVVFKGIVPIISLYALSIGFKTEFQNRFISYSGGDDAGSVTVATYNSGAPDYRYALLDFSFCGRCMIRFKIHQKGDEMWFGVIGDQNVLDERTLWKRGGKGSIWSYYCGQLSRYRRQPVEANFKSELNHPGVTWGAHGSLHFPDFVQGKLIPANTGDVVDLEVDAQEKTFGVHVNGVLQASTKDRRMPDQLSFWLELDSTNDRVEFELLDFNFKTRSKKMCRRNAKDAKDEV